MRKLALVGSILLTLAGIAACGGEASDGTGNGGSTLLPPSGLAYSVSPAVYTVGVAISANTPSSSGGAVTSYSVSPALPAGLSLNTSTGVISGTPTTVTATATYTVTATNSAGGTTVGLAVTVNAAVTSPSGLAYSVSPAVYTVGVAISANTPSSSGGAVTSYSVSPALPAGLSLNTSTGVISGTPTTVTATATYTVTATNSAGGTTVGLAVTVNAAVTSPSGLAYSVNPAVYTVGVAISANTPSSSGGAVTSYSVSPALPAGLSLNTSTGVISGTPTTVTATATYTVTATNSAGGTTVGLAVTVNAAVTSPSGLAYSVNPAVYTVGVAISANTPSSSGGAVTSYSVSPALPAGLSLNTSTGVISGTPTTVTATATYTVTATNSAGGTTVGLTVAVEPAAPGYSVQVSPQTLNFGDVLVGAVSAERTFQLTNTGTGALTPSFVALTNGTNAYFISSTTCAAALAPGASCTVGVTFQPALAGATSLCGVRVDIAEIATYIVVTLNGTGIPPGGTTYSVQVSPQTLNFGDVLVGTVSDPRRHSRSPTPVPAR